VEAGTRRALAAARITVTVSLGKHWSEVDSLEVMEVLPVYVH